MLPGPWIDDTYGDPGRVTLSLRWTSGASGAIGSFDSKHQYGFAATPAAHGSTGVYTLTLAGQPADIIKVTGQVRQASYANTGACTVYQTAVSLTAKTVTILITNAAGTAVDPTTSDVVTVEVVCQTYTPPV